MINAIEEPIRVRYAETDQMGHAYYANYLVWFEQARTALFRSRGTTYKEVEAMGYKLPVVEAWAKYREEVRYDDLIHVRVWVEEIKRASIRINYEVINTTTGKIATEGYTWHVLVGTDMKAKTIPDFLKELFQG